MRNYCALPIRKRWRSISSTFFVINPCTTNCCPLTQASTTRWRKRKSTCITRCSYSSRATSTAHLHKTLLLSSKKQNWKTCARIYLPPSPIKSRLLTFNFNLFMISTARQAASSLPPPSRPSISCQSNANKR